MQGQQDAGQMMARCYSSALGVLREKLRKIEATCSSASHASLPNAAVESAALYALFAEMANAIVEMATAIAARPGSQ